MECRSCKETILDKATWCPKCHRPQSILRALIPPQALAVIILALGGYWLVTVQAMEESMAQFSSDPIYEGANQLTVRDTSFNVTKNGCEACVSTIGTIKNNTETPWARIHFQVTYYNEENEVVDVFNDEDSDLIVGPMSERKFKVKGKASVELDEYHHNSVSIIKASPDSRWN
ncbi:hypothetical protein [uncultured Gilvimarinus sp.]|uniref:hypothetical protein n=1 Tax=uncultured Gilvimarinus sp. TaxID=1689143 RepID=UPI0030EED2DD